MDESRGDHRGRLPAGAREINGPKNKINERARWHARANAEMNGRFVPTSRVSPPQGRMVTVRSGGLAVSAALRRFGGWALIYGSGETPMPNPPEEWWLDDALAKEMGLDIDAIEAIAFLITPTPVNNPQPGNYEKGNTFARAVFARLFRLALRGDGLQFRWNCCWCPISTR